MTAMRVTLAATMASKSRQTKTKQQIGKEDMDTHTKNTCLS